MSVHAGKASLRARVAKRELMCGSFVKMTDTSSIEIFGDAGFDFVVIDQEHGAFDRAAINLALLASRAAGIAAVVRVPEVKSDAILAALDGGATGILAPHVTTVDDARALVAACRYRQGRRGFSGVTRAGGYGARAMWNHIDISDASIATIAMIEDPVALDNIAQIVAVEGLDGVFIGRGDLTVAFGAANRNDEVVVRAINRIFEAARVADKAVWVMVDSGTEAQTFLASGATAVIVSSDQALLRKAAAAAAHEVRLSIVQG